jgi:hypothetical protein
MPRWTRPIAVLLAVTTFAWAGETAAQAATGSIPLTPFNACPSVGQAPSCQVFIVINPDRSVSVYGDAAVGDYDGGDDTLVGVWNQSSQPVQALTVSGPGSDLAGFDGDGLCSFQVACGSGPTGYEGPNTAFRTDPATTDHVEVDFPSGLAFNATTYFGLEGTLTAAALTVREGHLDGNISVTTSVATLPIVPNPGATAFVRLKVKVVNDDGTPAVGATVKMSNANPATTFHTDAAGLLALTEPVNIPTGSGAIGLSVTANVTSASGATASATQLLYTATRQVSCSFDGRPGPDISLLEAMVPGTWGALETIMANLLPYLSKSHTNADGYQVTVPTSRTFYAQTLHITRRGGIVEYDGTGYGFKQLLKPPTGWYSSVSTGCIATSGLA